MINKRFVFLPVFAFLVFSCATDAALYKKIDHEVYRASFDTALKKIDDSEKSGSPNYSQRNAVLLCLDRGMIEHYAGRYAQSALDLQEGERLIEEAFTKSITQEAATFLVNDNARDYSGEDYEDIYINVFNALNYYQMGDLEGALVEARRSNEKLASLSGKYEQSIAKASGQVSGVSAPSGGDARFANSALARYLSAVFYRGSGMYDDARIDLDEIKSAYASAPWIYTRALPSSLGGEISVPSGKARLNIIAFAGFSPLKEEENSFIPLPFPPPNSIARIALPKLVFRSSVVDRVEAALDTGARLRLEELENLSAVAAETFKVKYSLVFFKSAARAVVKVGASAAAQTAASKHGNDLAGLLAGLLGQGYALASERADTRCARYFPGIAYVTGVTLEPGTYVVRVNYYSGDRIADSVEKTITALPDRANIIEAVSFN